MLFLCFFFLTLRPPPRSTLFPYTTLFRSPPLSDELFTVVRDAGVALKTKLLHPPGGGAENFNIHFRHDLGLFARSEEHTSELQSRQYLVCRLLLEKKKKTQDRDTIQNNLH